MTSRYRPGLIFCEMVKMDALIRHDPHTYRLLDYEGSMHPIGAQLCGSKASLAAPCGRIIEDLGFDLIDLNCGCPVDKVTRDGSGSGLLKNPWLIGEIVSNLIAAVKIPVTIKIRTGWDEEHIVAPLLTQIAEQAGACAITIHGRTRQQGYTGLAHRPFIRACKEVAKSIQVIGNGDIYDPQSAAAMFAETGCDAILVARGTFGQPWITEEIVAFLRDGVSLAYTGGDYKQALLDHISHIMTYQTERRALLDLRRIGAWYLKNGRGVRQLRDAFCHAKSLCEVIEMIEKYPWDEVDFSRKGAEAEREAVAVE
jgi:tRNA-dihydrouridine synthase B